MSWLKIRPKIVMVLAVVCVLALPVVTFMRTQTAVALSEAQRGIISQNCGSIQQSLRQLQVADSRTRVYLGSIYETILSDFMTPLATRVASNGLSLEGYGADLVTQQSDFSVSRGSFSTSYIEYQRALEGLVNYNCQTDPDGFYERLETVREQRADLAALVAQIRTKLDTHKQTVRSFSEELGGNSGDE